MKFIILGSGGTVAIPRPLCFCKICEEAREKGIPFARTGPSLYLEDEGVLFDTPSDIRIQIEREKIKSVKHVLYTHWHPDHTEGWRIFEQINGVLRDETLKPAIKVYVPASDVENFNKHCDGLNFLETVGYIQVFKYQDRLPIQIGQIKITPIDFNRSDRIRFGFKIEQNNKSVIYAPCSIYQMMTDKYFEDLDLLMIEKGWCGNPRETRLNLPHKHPFWDHIAFEENIVTIKKLKPKKTLFTHIGGSGHMREAMSHKDLIEICKKYPDLNIAPAFDGQKIEL